MLASLPVDAQAQSLFDLLYETLSTSFVGVSPVGSFFVMNLGTWLVDPGADYCDPEVQLTWAQTLNALTRPSPFFVPSHRTVWTELDRVFQAQQFPLNLAQPALDRWNGLKQSFAAARVELEDGRWFEQTLTVPDIASVGKSPAWTRIAVSNEQPTGVFSLELEVLQLKIVRPWLDGWMFRYRDWRWTPGSEEADTLLSDGAQPTQDTLPEGTMPFLPMSLILARDIGINYSLSRPSSTGSRRPAAGSGGSDSPILVLGWITEVLPLCPNPDPSFEWPPA